ncbi:MAG: hypothetical protein NT027_10465 [Proteobacteria bacterium]|nr:hypothetical protein [Pseudomonadota bacterium]
MSSLLRGTESLASTIEDDCRTGKLSSDAGAAKIEAEVKKLHKKLDQVSVTTLVVFLKYCSDGAISQDLFGILGVDVLLSNPGTLISSFSKVKIKQPRSPSLNDDFFLQKLGHAEGSDMPFVDCEKACLPKIDKLFNAKKDALAKAKLNTKADMEVRNALVKAVKNAQAEWHKRLQ